MMYTWLPSMTLCMSMLSNNTPSPTMPRGGLGSVNLEDRTSYTRYLDVVTMLVDHAKRLEQAENFTNTDRIDRNLPDPTIPENLFPCPPRPVDCEELLDCGFTQSGVYRIWPRSRIVTWGPDAGFPVYCDMETDGGGWTVIQRRDDFGTNSDFFFKGWQSYKFGFGDLNYDFWLGNDKIFALSNQRRTTLRFDLLDFDGSDGYATYDDFYVDDEREGYRLHLGDYRGIIGDSFKGHNLVRFSTRDRDNDNNAAQNCALLYKGGWWYNNCHTVNLNGLYLKGQHDTYADGVNWYGWKGFKYSLRKTEMKLRSSNFVRPVNGAPINPPILQGLVRLGRSSTRDNCPELRPAIQRGLGYNSCHTVNLNGLYLKGQRQLVRMEGVQVLAQEDGDEAQVWQLCEARQWWPHQPAQTARVRFLNRNEIRKYFNRAVSKTSCVRKNMFFISILSKDRPWHLTARMVCSNYLDGVPVKISSKFLPPNPVTIPLALESKFSTELLLEQYDFSLERKVIEHNTRRIQELEAAKAKPSKKDVEGATPDPSHKKNVSKTAQYPWNSSTILQPSSQQPIGKASNNAKSNNTTINLSDFENDTSSPFDYMELQTINDLEELNSVFQGISSRNDQEVTEDPKAVEETSVAKSMSFPSTQNPWQEKIPTSHSENFSSQRLSQPDENLTATSLPANNSLSGHHTIDPYLNLFPGANNTACNYTLSQVPYIASNAGPPLLKELDSSVSLRGSKSYSDIRSLSDMEVMNSERGRSHTPPTYCPVATPVTQEETLPLVEDHFQVPTDEPSNGVCNSDTTAYGELDESSRLFVDSLTEMGFPQGQVARAVKHLGIDEKKVVEHLCQIQALEESGYDSSEAEAALHLHDYNRDQAKEFLDLVNQFQDLGFEKDAVKKALVQNKNDWNKTIDALLP
ncbi:hypothetical protein JTE90_006980 [Oedothorax gibbosus]|uniref:Uncharacterized protein n=1 Tax=Oedothorax gibbosus TaxID=931172 RepID=A0AAV6VAZ9_9ARAC|nr:hypothetical protein JTE90_006980 [Oedothorax gibbosus]